MRQKLENKLNMFDAVLFHLANFPLIVALRVALGLQETSLKGVVTAIRSTDSIIEAATTGIATDKGVLRENTVQQGFSVASAIIALSSKNGDQTTADQVDYSLSEMRKLSDEVLPQVIDNINTIATAKLVDLADYGITAPVLAAMMLTLASYSGSIGKPRNATAFKKTMNKNMIALFKQGSKLLKNEMDKTVNTLKATEPNFVETYYNDRKIIDQGGSHTTLKGKVFDPATGEELADVEVTIVEAEKKTKSVLDGTYLLKEFKGGLFTINYVKPGYVTVVKTSVRIKQGASVELIVEMSKI